jgi:hypothetical protein
MNMFMKRIPVLIVLLIVLTVSVFGEDASLLESHILRIGLASSFGSGAQNREGVDTGRVNAFNIGAGIEYGISGRLSVQALWMPGVNAWAAIDDGGKYGYFSDAFLGVKAGIIGPAALVQREDMRFSIAAGAIMPLPVRADSDLEGDYHLWGSTLRLYYDYIFSPLFYLDAFVEASFFPNQKLDSPNFADGSVFHPLELTVELDSRFKQEIESAGMVLHWGIPLAYSVAPWTNWNDADARWRTQHRFNTGLFFTASFLKTKMPFDITVKYQAPVYGKNDLNLHRLSLAGRIYIKLPGEEAEK